MAQARTRVLVVEDSLTVRHRLIEILGSDPELEVVGDAADGRSAIECCERLRPDVVTMDMMLPVMTGLAATEYIMAYCATPILIVSASVNRGELFRTYEALAAGAVDVLEKPAADAADGEWERRFLTTVKRVAGIKVITHLRARMAARNLRAARTPSVAPAPAGPGAGLQTIAVGVSTGAPGTLKEILAGLPANFQVPILVVVHLAAPFAGHFAEWLDGVSPIRVAYAVDGEPLPPHGSARVLLAPPDRHLVLRDGRLRLDGGPERHSCRPSVDVLFESLARESGPRCAAALLTGMGRDGAAGLLAIRRAGGRTLAQDEATSVVFGMPREAIALGAAERVVALPEVADVLLEWSRNPLREART